MAKARVIRCGGGLRYYIKRFPVMCIYASVFVVCMILFCSWLFSWKGIWFVPKQDLYWPVPACILGVCFANVCAYYLDGAGWHISLFVGKVIAFYFIIRFAHDLWVAEQGWIHLPSWLKYVIQGIQQDKNRVWVGVGALLLAGSVVLKWLSKDTSKEQVPCSQWNVYSNSVLRSYRFYSNIITSVYAIYISYLLLQYSHMHMTIAVFAAIIVFGASKLSSGSHSPTWRIHALVVHHIVNVTKLPVTRKGLVKYYTHLIQGQYGQDLSQSPYYLMMREVHRLFIGGYEAVALQNKGRVIENVFSEYVCGMPHECCSKESNESVYEMAFYIGMGCAPTKYKNIAQYKADVEAIVNLLSGLLFCDKVKYYMMAGLVSGVVFMLDDVSDKDEKAGIVDCADKCIEDLMEFSDSMCIRDHDKICLRLQLNQSKVESKEYAEKVAVAKHFNVQAQQPQYDYYFDKMQDLYLNLKYSR